MSSGPINGHGVSGPVVGVDLSDWTYRDGRNIDPGDQATFVANLGLPPTAPYVKRYQQTQFITDRLTITGNGTSDDTDAVRDALTYYASQGQDVVIPDGCQMRLTSPISIAAPAVRLRGQSPSPMYDSPLNSGDTPRNPTSSGFVRDHNGKMMTFTSDPSVVGATGIGNVYLANFNVWENQPAYTMVGGVPTFTPNDSDFTFDFRNVESTVDNVNISNVSRGFLVRDCSGKGTWRNIKGQPLRVGVDIRNAYNPQNLDQVFFWPFWSMDAPVLNWMRTGATAWRTGRHDNPHWGYVFCLGYWRGLHFYNFDPSDKTLYPQTGPDVPVGAGGPTGRFGADRVDVDASTDNILVDADIPQYCQVNIGYLAGQFAPPGMPMQENFRIDGAGQFHFGLFDPGFALGSLLVVDPSGPYPAVVDIDVIREYQWDLGTGGTGTTAAIGSAVRRTATWSASASGSRT